MTRLFIYKRFISIALTTLLCIVGTSSLMVASGQENSIEGAPIAIPFNAERDRPSVMPAEREQSDSPLGEGSRAVIGRDERYPVLSRQYPWSTMGRLEWRVSDESYPLCTATLIGPSAVLTNSHCLLNKETLIAPEEYSQLLTSSEGQTRLVFAASMIDGQALDEANVVGYETGWTSEKYSTLEDWAILQLDRPLGDRYGYMGWRDLDFTNSEILESAREKINLLGYSGDFPTPSLQTWGEPMETAGVDLACSILGIWPEGSVVDGVTLEGTLAHDCDTSYGASGGPILAKFSDDEYYLVGLHASRTPVREVRLPDGTTTNVINGGVPTARWAAAAQRSRGSL